jgi:hypothetical protein
MSAIVEVIRTAMAGMIKADIIVGEVTKFDKSKWLATVKFNETLELGEVSVKSVINTEKSGIFVEPKIGSIVTCGLIEGKVENLFIIGYSEVVKCHFNTDQTIIESKKITLKNEQVNFADLLTDLKTLLLGLKVNTPAGPSVGLLPDSIAAIEQLDVKFKQIFE